MNIVGKRNNIKVEKLKINDTTKKMTLILKQKPELPLLAKMHLKINRTDSTLVESDIVDPECVKFIELKDMGKEIPQMISKSRKIVVLTGAGISCNAGIPDFRSSDGLYNKQLNSKVKGKEMFDVSVYRSLETIEMFNTFINELYQQVLQAKPTRTHHFIRKLKNKNKLLKCYTQNIDGLERQCGLECDFNDNKWDKIDVIQLHGDLHSLTCSSCKSKFQWSEIYDERGVPQRIRDYQREMQLIQKREEELMKQQSSIGVGMGIEDYLTPPVSDESDKETEVEILGGSDTLVECPKCIDHYEMRLEKGKRCCESHIGIIRPNIVLYGENHPYSETFAHGINKDMQRKPNLMLIFGTSLKVAGVKGLVRKMAKRVHEEGGKVVLVNRDLISNSSWKGYIDYQIVSDCDGFCDLVEQLQPRMFKGL